MLRLDNRENARIVEMCYKTHTTLVNPIIDWSTDEIWEFIKEYNIPYCHLYDQGYKRLGCIGCPMAGGKAQVKGFERYPKFKNLYLLAFDKMLKNNEEKGIDHKWDNAEDVFNWWVGIEKEQESELV